MEKRYVLILSFLIFGAPLFAKLSVVVSIAPLYNITRAIAGDRADIIMLVPPGASEHTYSPKPAQVEAMANADIFIRIGAGMEFWADKMIAAAESKKLKVLTLTQGVKLIAGADEDEKAGNPHIWLDPVLAKDMAAKIKGILCAVDADGTKTYAGNLKVFDSKADKLDVLLKKEIKKFRVKDLVSMHPAWVYFEKRYGLNEVGVIEMIPGKEPSPNDIKDIINSVKKYSIKAVFAEPQLPRKAADVIASEAGVKVVILDPLGAVRDTPDGYFDFIMKNFYSMKEAMN
jgi:ABC-type Zn uptake system ZnuABC Zn-binding protein ZnuA